VAALVVGAGSAVLLVQLGGAVRRTNASLRAARSAICPPSRRPTVQRPLARSAAQEGHGVATLECNGDRP